ncbi:hypothetical protein B0J12DRAFT_599886 [Macrophomina phaseolina]|uniref:Carbohydrate-binding-like protein n=1 Tax=Macrophomina phaseolina TaxID=35725 RepID=A0ABQ8GF19_9PEZI|nr:hypothetical protein B0J12DRAFT_599886 [Macrophomina phaseolina]
MHSLLLLQLLAGLAAVKSSPVPAEIPADGSNPPDALDLAFLKDLPDPTYSTIDGVMSQDVPYATQTAIEAVVADDNAAPTATSRPDKRDLRARAEIAKRAACGPQAVIPNYYNVDVSTYDNFKNDAKISQVASAAQDPQGYYHNFKNLKAANSAYAYLGYIVLTTGYDVNKCAEQCTRKEGCLAFNIYFERDPKVEPGNGCRNPEAFANIKCSFWGGALDASTANNAGQWRADFHVGIAGSNAYTSDKVGPPIPGWNDPLKLNDAAMNAPLRDCAGTWTYMGYKLLNDGPFDVKKCAAACDAQTAYNIAHPPASGYVPLCAAFGTYLLTKTTSSGSVIQGQMCTMYTSAWDAQYAVNRASYDGSIGAKYTYSYSFFYSKPNIQPVCESDLSYLRSAGSEFCSSYISYTPSTSVEISTTTPGVSTVYETSDSITTTTVTSTTSVTAAPAVQKRDEDSYTGSDYSIQISTITVLNTGKSAVANATLSPTQIAKRAVETPASVTGWPAVKLSAACSRVATGIVLTTSITTAPVPLTTEVISRTSTETTTTVSTLTIPAVLLPSPTVVVTGRNSDDNMYQLDLPFAISIYGISSSTVYLTDNSVLFWPYTDRENFGWEYRNQALPYTDPSQFGKAALFGLWDDLYVYGNTNQGIYYDITGEVGARTVTFEFYSSAFQRSNEFYHFTIAMYENVPDVAEFKYYDVFRSGYSATVGAQKRGKQEFLPSMFHSDHCETDGPSVQYSYNSEIITPGLKLVVDTRTNTITSGSFTP